MYKNSVNNFENSGNQRTRGQKLHEEKMVQKIEYSLRSIKRRFWPSWTLELTYL